MKSSNLVISEVKPLLGVPGGEIEIGCSGFTPGLPGECRVLFGAVEARITTASEDRIVVKLPDSPDAPGIALERRDLKSEVLPFTLGSELATGLHPVTSPAMSPDGDIVTTISGSRGQQVHQPMIRIGPSGAKIPYECKIMNPTGVAFGKDGRLYVSSRNDGTVLRFNDDEGVEIFAEDLGVVCGIAFDSKGFLFAGDRTGKIYRIDPLGEKEVYASLEASVSAYHLAVDSGDRLYVTGPTLSMRDALYRIAEKDRVEILLHDLARPQGMAFLEDGDLLITASRAGRKGVFKYSPQSGGLVHFIAAPTLVGLAVTAEKFVLAGSSTVYTILRSPRRSRVS